MQEEVLVKDAGIINGDKEYMEECFALCGMFRQKRGLISRIKVLKETPEKAAPGGKIRRLEAKLGELNADIRERDAAFWARVKMSLARGKKFAIEEIAAAHRLELYEKRMMAFFFYLEFCHVQENECLEEELSKIFDFEDSLFNRMRDFRYFDTSARLVMSAVIIKDHVRTRGSATARFLLSETGINLFVSLLNGERSLLECEKLPEPEDDCVDAGLVREPEYKLGDVVLKDDIKEKVLFLLDSAGDKKMEELGVSQKIKKGRGLAFLFYGPPGTGKSMLAEAVAEHLKKKLLIVEFPKLASRWYGETDKHLAGVFKSARINNLVICIDEADSLLYNRNFAVQEHDIRFVNIMLQEIERFEGEIILTTNMDNLLDPALERRVSLKVKFGLPDEKMRAEIWRSHIPDKVKIAGGVDFESLGRQFQLSGGYIKNAVLHAMRRLANDGRDTVDMEDLLFGARLEQDGAFVKESKPKIGFFAIS